MSLYDVAIAWEDTVECAISTRALFEQNLVDDAELFAHRQFTKNYGMGEDAFHWLWKLLVVEVRRDFQFLEVGVYKGQILSLIRLLADRTHRSANIVGVTMLNTFAGSRTPHEKLNYYAAIKEVHDHFRQPMPLLLVGDSTSDEIHARVRALGPIDIIYVDGCHDYKYVIDDLLFYGSVIRAGGFLVVDDAANDLQQPAGWFHGIEDVTKAVQTVILTSAKWRHVMTVCHNRVFFRRDV